MVVSYVKFPTDVYFVCCNHALSTDGEEIVGLLVGQVENQVADISAVILLRRSDKRKDRVEISPEQLSNASTEAEHMSVILKKTVRVIGWYHSHPKLTVWPSTIDVNTQDNYQLMEQGFIGLIFSVFIEEPNKKGGRIILTCYQSESVLEGGNIEKKRVDIPVHIVPTNYISSLNVNALIQLPSFLCEEEVLAYQAARGMNLDFLTTLHNSSVYIKSVGQIAEVICGPLVKMLEERIINNEMKRKKLQTYKKEKMALLEQLKKEVAELKVAVEAKPDIALELSQNLPPGSEMVPAVAVESKINVEAVEPLASVFEGVSPVVQSLDSSSSATIIDCPRPHDVFELAEMAKPGLSVKDGNLPGSSHIETELEEGDIKFPAPTAAQGEKIDFELASPPLSPESSP